MATRLASFAACAALAVSAGACAVLLDLPAPELGDGGGPTVEAAAPQPDGGDAADDATIDTASDAEPDRTFRDTAAQDTAQDTTMEAAVADVAPDNQSDAGGVLCSLTTSYSCDPLSSTPDCCETASDSSSTPSFACVPLMTCPGGYDIECANADDCPGSKICCHYASYMRCETPSGSASTCPGSSITQACDPNNTGECPASQSCTLHLTNNGLPSPYWGCE